MTAFICFSFRLLRSGTIIEYFSTILVINRVSILAIFVIYRVSILEEEASFFIIDRTINKSL